MQRIFLVFFFCLSLIPFFEGYSQLRFSSVTNLPVNLNNGSNWLASTGCINSGSKGPISFNITGLPSILTPTFSLNDIRVTFNTSSAGCGTNLRDLWLMLKKMPNGPCYIFYDGNPTPAVSGSGASTLLSSSDVTINLRDNPGCANLQWVGFDAISTILSRTVTSNSGYFRAGCNNCSGSSAGQNQLSTSTLAGTFNNVDPNGTWNIYAYYYGAPGNAPCITGASIGFGSPAVLDRTPDGDNCDNAIEYTGIPFCGTTRSTLAVPKTGSVLMPGSLCGPNTNTMGTINGTTCGWNFANNNDVWIKYTATKSEYQCFNISGFGSGGLSLQSIIVSDANTDGDGKPCTGKPKSCLLGADDPNWNIVSCPRPSVYTSTAGTVKNQQHCFVTEANKTYYIIVDGTGGAENPFYFSGITGSSQASLSNNNIIISGDIFSGGNLLKWTSTLPNELVSSYRLERSFNNQKYHTLNIQTVNINRHNDFLHIDKSPLAGNNYYRVKAEMKDGSLMYSSVVMLRGKAENKVTIFPNPALNFLNISSAVKIKDVSVFNTQGQLLYTADKLAGLQSLQIPTQSWAKGQYLVIVTDQGGNVERIKILK